MSREELRAELTRRLGDWELPRLCLRLREENTPPYQAIPRARYKTPPVLADAAKACRNQEEAEDWGDEVGSI